MRKGYAGADVSAGTQLVGIAAIVGTVLSLLLMSWVPLVLMGLLAVVILAIDQVLR